MRGHLEGASTHTQVYIWWGGVQAAYSGGAKESLPDGFISKDAVDEMELA